MGFRYSNIYFTRSPWTTTEYVVRYHSSERVELPTRTCYVGSQNERPAWRATASTQPSVLTDMTKVVFPSVVTIVSLSADPAVLLTNCDSVRTYVYATAHGSATVSTNAWSLSDVDSARTGVYWRRCHRRCRSRAVCDCRCVDCSACPEKGRHTTGPSLPSAHFVASHVWWRVPSGWSLPGVYG